MAALVSLGEIKDYLTIVNSDNDNQLKNLANYASTAIESYCGREFNAVDVINEFHDGGSEAIFVNTIPLNSINVVSEYDGIQYVPLIGPNLASGERPNVAANANAVIAYVWSEDTGEISRHVHEGSSNPPLNLASHTVFRNYTRGVKVSYNGGYTTIPNDLKMATLDFVKMLWKKEQASQSFSLQGESKSNFNLAPNGFPPHIKRILDFYRILI